MHQIPADPRLHHLLTARGIEAPFGLQAANTFLIVPQRDLRFFTGVVTFGFQVETLKTENVTRQFNLLPRAQVQAYLLTATAGKDDPRRKHQHPGMRQQCRKLDAERHVAASDRCQHDNQQHQQAKGQRSAVKVWCAYGEPSPAEQPVNHRVERANQHNQQHRTKEQQRNQNQHLA